MTSRDLTTPPDDAGLDFTPLEMALSERLPTVMPTGAWERDGTDSWRATANIQIPDGRNLDGATWNPGKLWIVRGTVDGERGEVPIVDLFTGRVVAKGELATVTLELAHRARARIPGLETIARAYAYLAAGFSVIPVAPWAPGREPKKPGRVPGPDGKWRVLEWKPYETRLPTLDELDAWLTVQPRGVAIVCGRVSGGLEVLDFDIATGRTNRYADWLAALPPDAREVAQSLPRVATPGGGNHLYYRCQEVSGGAKLACLADPEPKPDDWHACMIETRGEGNYVVAPGSSKWVHPTRKEYKLVSSTPIESTPTIDPATRAVFLATARSLDERPDHGKDCTSTVSTSTSTSTASGPTASMSTVHDVAPVATKGPRPVAGEKGHGRTGDDYAVNGPEWAEILEPHGWRVAKRGADKVEWTRPGKTSGTSATTDYCSRGSDGADLFFVFSSNADPLQPGKGYSKFAAHALLNHGGDFHAAARALAAEGYGEPLPAFDSYHRTDVGNADRLADRHGADIRYGLSGWLAWNGARWERSPDGAPVQERAKETMQAVGIQAIQLGDEGLNLRKWALASEANARIHAMVDLATSKPELRVVAEDLDKDPWAFNATNGTVDLRTGDLRPHRREDMLTRMSPVAYDPAAPAPRWERFIREIMGDNENLVAFLRRALGYCLSGSTREQCLFFFYGSGANGKTTIVNAILDVMGEYGRQAAPGLLLAKRNDNEHPVGIADLHGARMVVATEVDEGKRLAESLVKSITGGDRIKARHLYGQLFEWTPTHKIILSANHKPTIKGTEYAIWRRIMLVPFNVVFSPERRDPDLEVTLRNERVGILSWLVRGSVEYAKDGLRPPEEVQAATAEYRREQDRVSPFVEECCQLDPKVSIRASALFAQYELWSSQVEDRPMSKKGFWQRLATAYPTLSRRRGASDGNMIYDGITVVGHGTGGKPVGEGSGDK